MRVPITAAILHLREDKLQPTFVNRVVRPGQAGKNCGADQRLRKQMNKFAAIHKEFEINNSKLKKAVEYPGF
jgi:hypothetical protein